MPIYTFLKSPCHGTLKFAKMFAKFSKIKFVLSFQAFQRAIKSLNPMTGSGFKYRFSRVQIKKGIQAVCLRTQAVSIKALL